MLMMLKTMMIMTTIMIMLSMLNNMMMKKKKKKNNNSPYECGFMIMNKKRMPLSTQFYMISIIFLIFDLEMMMIIPMILTMKNSSMKFNKMIISMMLMMMMITIMYEWLNKSIKWKM